MPLALIPPGRFLMGSPETERTRLEDEGPRREVAITRGFYLGVVPVTQAQFLAVMGDNPAFFHEGNGGGPDHPVEAVTWAEAVEFCRRLSQLPDEKAAGRAYRLPTEAEWEYACRAGTTSPFFFGEALTAEQANYRLSYPGHILHDGRSVEYPPRRGPDGLPLEKTSPVGSYPANAWGLHDLHGNVWEWCADRYEPGWYQAGPEADPVNTRGDRPRLIRGGAWREPAWKCRSASREGWPLPPADPGKFRSYDLGFRVVCGADGVKA
jgi:formylglycine-generating enzyme required for sulfatase activity